MMTTSIKFLLTFFMRTLLSALLVMQFFVSAHAGNLIASVDRDTIGLEETFTLTLRYDEQINATPDYELLRRDFDILHTQSGTQMTITNGRAEAYTEWRIALAPKRIGKLLIPSFNIDDAVSDAIEMTIEGKSRSPQNGSSNVSVELETDKDSAYVQEQIIITVRLYTAVALSGVNLEPLNIPNALVMQLDEKQYQTSVNGRPHVVAETRFALYPQQSGELVIPSLLYQVAVDNGQGSMWNRSNNNNVLRLRTDEQRLNILATPAEAKNNTWMPANNVTIKEHWSAGIDTLKVGEPITRSITIVADGLTAGQVPPLTLSDVDGLTFYQDQAQTDDQKNEAGVVGTRIETIAIIPNRAGKLTLPEVNLRWWDTKQKIFKTATLDAVTLDVTGSALTPQNLVEDAPPDSTEVGINTDLGSITTPNTITVNKIPMWIYLCSLLSIISTLIFAALYWKNKRELADIYATNNAERQEQAKSENQAWNQIKKHLSEKELVALRNALIHWAQIHWQAPNIMNLHTLSEKANHPPLTEQLTKLDAAIYSGKTQDFDSQILLETLGNLRRQKQKNATPPHLQPLYKNS